MFRSYIHHKFEPIAQWIKIKGNIEKRRRNQMREKKEL